MVLKPAGDDVVRNHDADGGGHEKALRVLAASSF
jgi:hypothetical protein